METSPAKLVMAVMYVTSVHLDEILETLSDRFGAVDGRSETYLFEYSDYYHREMGSGLKKFLLSFGPLIPRDRLYKVKQITNRLERDGSEGSHRRYNLDPGILTLSNFVLATTKDCAHRVYMGEGIYQEVTLIYRGRHFQPLPWTYPDYRNEALISFLGDVRDIYKQQLTATNKVRETA